MTNEQYLKNLSVPTGIVDAVIDTDTFNEIDDQFAVSFMLLSKERINAKAIYAAPFFNSHSTSPEDGMQKSYTAAFIIKYNECGDIEKSMKFASAASAIVVTRLGASVSIPARAEVDRFLAEQCVR